MSLSSALFLVVLLSLWLALCYCLQVWYKNIYCFCFCTVSLYWFQHLSLLDLSSSKTNFISHLKFSFIYIMHFIYFSLSQVILPTFWTLWPSSPCEDLHCFFCIIFPSTYAAVLISEFFCFSSVAFDSINTQPLSSQDIKDFTTIVQGQKHYKICQEVCREKTRTATREMCFWRLEKKVKTYRTWTKMNRTWNMDRVTGRGVEKTRKERLENQVLKVSESPFKELLS